MNKTILFFRLIIFLFFFFSISGKSKNHKTNPSSVPKDTIVVKMVKQKGNGLFRLASAPIKFKDTTEVFSNSVKFPKNIDKIKRVQLKSDLREDKEYYLEIMTGYKNGKKIFIVDENNNKNFTDDSIRIYKKINWSSSADLIKCEYFISNGRNTIKDSSWLNIGDSNGTFLLGKREFLIGEINIDNMLYKIGIAEPTNPLIFNYGIQPEIAILSHHGIKKDSLQISDKLELGEFLNLNNKYYCFENISNNGEFVTLVREKNFKSKVGTQTGMLAPSFTVITTSGDTLKSSDIKKITVIANSCGCGGDKESIQAFYEMEKIFGKTINILHIDSNIKKTDFGIHIDSEDKFNKPFYKNYRKQYCSRICYVIGKNKIIIDKFNIDDWKITLPKIIKN